MFRRGGGIAWIIAVVLLPHMASAAEGGTAPALPARPRLVAQLGHSGIVTTVAFSPNSRLALTGSSDQTARLWEVATGLELGFFTGHKGEVNSVAFSPRGDLVLTGSADGTAALWDIGTCKQVLTFRGHSGPVSMASFSSCGRFVLTSSSDKTARVWEVATGKEMRRLQGHSDRVHSAVFSADSNYVLTSSADKTARLWEAVTGMEVRRLAGHAGSVSSAVFSPDGRQVLTGSADRSARLWDTATGKELRVFGRHTGGIRTVAFSSDNRWVLTCSNDLTTRLWDAQTAQELRQYKAHAAGPFACAIFSPDGRWVLTGHHLVERIARLWDVQTGEPVRRFEGQAAQVDGIAVSPDGRSVATAVVVQNLAVSPDGRSVEGVPRATVRLWDAHGGAEAGHFPGGFSVAFSPDGRSILTDSDDHAARLVEAATGNEVQRFKGHSGRVKALCFSPDGRWVLTGSAVETTARLWERATGKTVLIFKGHKFGVLSVAFSPDSRSVFTGDADGTVRQWDSETGKLLRHFATDLGYVWSLCVSLDGRSLLAGGFQLPGVELWDVGGGKRLRPFPGHTFTQGLVAWVQAAAFSPDGRWVLTGGGDGTARLWEAATGKELRRFLGHSDKVKAVAFSPGGRSIWTAGGEDCTARLWEVASGRELCRLISFKDDTWAVVDAEGRFDASHGGDVPGLHWVVGNEGITLDQLKARYYEPGLLAKYLGLDKSPLREVAAFAAPKLFPGVRLTGPTRDNPQLGITLTNRGGGIGRVVIMVNGKEVTDDARGPSPDPAAKTLKISFDLAAADVEPLLKPGEKNHIEVQAFNAEDYLRSPSCHVSYEAPGQMVDDRPELWAVVVGISEYRDPLLTLDFAAGDAADFARALATVGGRFFGSRRVHLELLTTRPGPGQRPTRANLVKVLAAARKAKPKDVVVIYLAGHAVTRGVDQGEYYYYSCEAQNEDKHDPEVLKQTALSGKELADLIKRIPAARQVMILDTCVAERALDRLVAGRDSISSQARALERLKDATGLHILAGCARDAKSFESHIYGQGLLTYSLLKGMHGEALRDEEFVDVNKLFIFARNTVPELAKRVNRHQFPRIASPRDEQSFDIGQVALEDSERMPPLKTPRPIVQFMAFMEENQLTDALGLGKRIRDQLRDASALGLDAPLVLVDAREEILAAYQLSGLYKIDNARVIIKARLAKGNEKELRFVLEGTRGKEEELIAQLVEKVEKHVVSSKKDAR